VAGPPAESSDRPNQDEGRQHVVESRGADGDRRGDRRPPPGPRRPGPPGGLWPWLAALLLVVLAGVALAYVLTRDANGSDGGTTVEQVAVPGVVGFSAREAATEARRAGLRTAVRRRLGPQAAGTVVAQRPDAGVEVARGSLLVLTVSRGPAPVEVPDLIGLNQAQAGVRLAEVGLEPAFVRVTSSKPSGQVIAQRPRAGAGLAEGSKVHVTVSKGGKPEPTTTATTATTTTSTTTTTTTSTTTGLPPSRPVKVPNVLGDTLEAAISKISNAGLVPGPTIVASDKPAGTVVAQSPRGGSTADTGTIVRISISAP
jgi:beta-lactam-binding protein with PASTA domain